MKVKDAMTTNVVLASPGQTICEAARMMAECGSGVLPVGDSERLVGILSFGDLATITKPRTTGEAIAAISQPGGPHDQTLH